MSYNDTPTVPFDSITSGTLRMALRRWYFIVAAVVVGLILGVTVTSGVERQSVSQSSRVLNLTAASSFMEQPLTQIDVSALSRRLTSSIASGAYGDDVTWSITADTAAGTLDFAVTALTSEEAFASLADLVDTAHTIAAEDLILSVSSTVAALGAERDLLEARIAATDAEIDRLATQANASIALGPLYAERSVAATELAEVNSKRVHAENYVRLLQEDLFVNSEPQEETNASSQLNVLLMGFAFGVIALLVCAAAVVLDGRVRRRVQIEHFVPATSTVAVLSQRPGDNELLDARRAISEFHAQVSKDTSTKITTVLLQPLDGNISSVDQQVVENLEIDGTRVLLLSDARSDSSYGSADTIVLYSFRFGKVGHNQLSASVNAALAAGNVDVGVIMTNVPRQDVAWASS